MLYIFEIRFRKVQKLSDDILLLKNETLNVKSSVAAALPPQKVNEVLIGDPSAALDDDHNMTNDRPLEEDIDLVDLSDNSMDHFVPLEMVTGEKPALN